MRQNLIMNRDKVITSFEMYHGVMCIVLVCLACDGRLAWCVQYMCFVKYERYVRSKCECANVCTSECAGVCRGECAGASVQE